MPLDDSIAFVVLRGLLAVLRFLAETLMDYFFAWVGKGALYVFTLGRVNPDLDNGSEYVLACAVGVLVSVAFLAVLFRFAPFLKGAL